MSLQGHAQSSNVVQEIVVQGNKKIETPAILEKLSTKKGEAYSLEKVREDVRSLFATDFFYDVIVDQSNVSGGVRVTYTVEEKPSILEIEYDGNSELDDDEMAESSGLKAYEILDISRVNEAVDKLLKLYEEKGFFLARLDYKIEPIKDSPGVRVRFVIDESEKVQVKQIRILGNNHLSDDKLKSMMRTQEGGFFSFIGSDSAYQQDTFDQDIRLLSFLYFNEGYVQVNIDRPQVTVTPDKKSIYITIRIEEGQQFNVGEIDFAGDLLFDTSELLEGTTLKSDELFVSESLQKDLRTLQAKYGDLGYAFANVIPRTRVREKERLVDVTYEIDKGQKVYIGKINVSGNTRTRDKVVRRELKIVEGELYHETRKRESEENVQRLGFFDEVSFNTSSPDGKPDVIDIDINVKERNTGTIQLGAGYSSYSKFVINGQVNQMNLFGLGQKLGASINFSEKESNYNLNWTDPYFRDTKWSFGIDAFQLSQTRTEYEQEKKGGAVRLGYPLAPYLYGFVRYKYEDIYIDLNENSDESLFDTATVNGITSSVTVTTQYDRRNDRFTPSKGVFGQLALEYAGLGGDIDYTKGSATFRYYKKIFWEVVWRNNITYGFVTPNKSDEDVPFNELYLLGGANTLRGYQFFTVGKRKYSADKFSELSPILPADEAEKLAYVPFGGEQQFYYNLEFQFPLVDEAGIKGVLFYDIGYADDVIRLEDLKSNFGFGFRWFSPIGPLRFEWGVPIAPDEDYGEDDVFFQFAVGTPF
ncbi:MAG: outer membrane protein assembly factor BamA [Bdellovibrionales bacterium]